MADSVLNQTYESGYVVKFSLLKNAFFTHVLVQYQFPVTQIVEDWTEIGRIAIY